MSDKELLKEPDVSTSKEFKESKPRQFRVLMHNDDYTTMEFVVDVLEEVFNKSSIEANRIMLSVHIKGTGVCGLYPRDVAETKINRAHSMARKEGLPLMCSMEEV